MRAGSRFSRTVAPLLLVSAFALGAAAAPVPVPSEPAGTDALGLVLRRLSHLGTILFITAHPDDENNAVLVALARGEGARTALLTATRGEGGQNEIGPEIGEALGILRGGELEAIHRRDGAEQYFGRAYDFGYSFSVDETYAKWEKDAILADFVRTIRAVRPDVIVTLRREAPGGGQHHQAAARLAALAFRAAGDAVAFPPEANGGLEPWQARKIYEGTTGITAASEPGLSFDTGTADPFLGGRTWFDFGSRLRTLHRTQGMGLTDARRGTSFTYRLIDSEPPIGAPPAESRFFASIDTSWSRLRELAGAHEREQAALDAAVPAIAEDVRRAQEAFAAEAPQKVLPPLRSALTLLRRLREEALVGPWDPRVRLEILSRLEPKIVDLMEAIALAHQIRFTATADDAEVVPGQRLAVAAAIHNDGREPIKIEDVVWQTPEGWTSEDTERAPGVLESGSRGWRANVTVAADAVPTRPLGRKHPTLERYELAEGERTGQIFLPPPLGARLFFTSGGLLVSIDRVVVREDVTAAGPRRRAVSVVPPFSVRFASPVRVIPSGAKARATVELHAANHAAGAAQAICRLETREGWSAAPAEARLRFTREDEEQTVRFELSPPRGAAAAASITAAVSSAATATFREERHLIDPPHVSPRRWVRDATVTARTVDARVAERTVGYIMGVGDRVPEAIEQLGPRVVMLSDVDIASGNLARFPTIVAGLRAYLRRDALKQHHARLMEYMRQGGHFVVQYNRMELNDPTPFTPYPAAVTAERLTDETAPVRILDPRHALLTTPNRLGPDDFEGWVQERGLSFLDARDAQYEDLLAGTDPFPENAGEKKGMLVTAKVGAGRWTYVGLALWRQLQAGVPGAYRLLANLVSQPAVKAGGIR